MAKARTFKAYQEAVTELKEATTKKNGKDGANNQQSNGIVGLIRSVLDIGAGENGDEYSFSLAGDITTNNTETISILSNADLLGNDVVKLLSETPHLSDISEQNDRAHKLKLDFNEMSDEEYNTLATKLYKYIAKDTIEQLKQNDAEILGHEEYGQVALQKELQTLLKSPLEVKRDEHGSSPHYPVDKAKLLTQLKTIHVERKKNVSEMEKTLAEATTNLQNALGIDRIPAIAPEYHNAFKKAAAELPEFELVVPGPQETKKELAY